MNARKLRLPSPPEPRLPSRQDMRLEKAHMEGRLFYERYDSGAYRLIEMDAPCPKFAAALEDG